MATFKNQKEAKAWLESKFGCFLDENSDKGKYAAYVPAETDDGMVIGYGDSVVTAIADVAGKLEAA